MYENLVLNYLTGQRFISLRLMYLIKTFFVNEKMKITKMTRIMRKGGTPLRSNLRGRLRCK